MKIFNATKNTVIAHQVVTANSLLHRAMGLLNHKSLKQGEALIIPRCQAIHMFFMRFPIDVIFVDGKNSVVGVVAKIKPFQLSPIFWKADYAIELPVGTIEQSKISFGDLIRIDSCLI